MSLLAAALALTLAVPSTSADFGAVASAPLPAGGLSVWGMGGYPELRAGFREGLQYFEIAGTAGIDYLRAAAFGQLGVRAPMWLAGPLRLSMDFHVGGFADGGADYQDRYNRAGAGLRFELGSELTYKTPGPISLQASARIPMEVPLTREGTIRILGLLGAGVEVAVSKDYYVVFDGAFGPDLRRQRDGASNAMLAVEAMVGFGRRLF